MQYMTRTGMQKIIGRVVAREKLAREEVFQFLDEIKSGAASPVQIGGLLVGLVMKGIDVDELLAIVEWMRNNAVHVRPKVDGIVIDTCGTGGGLLTFNVSTASAIVAAASNVPVAKHGSRSISHKSGSADVLERLNVKINLTKEQAERLIEETNFTFLFAPLFHPMMHKILGPEQELGVKTVFYTLVGPLINPALVKAHVLGVYRREIVEPIAQVLAGLGYARALVVHGLEGLDEISNTGETVVAEVQNGRLYDVYEIVPEDFGIPRSRAADLAPEVDSPEYNAELIIRLLKGDRLDTAKRDFLLLNSAGALYVGGKVKCLKDGLEFARNVIDEGLADRKLEEISEVSQKVMSYE
ncbi:MAG: anthranilate phosphoribosyltransferase [Nitrososphaeria archaeon]